MGRAKGVVKDEKTTFFKGNAFTLGPELVALMGSTVAQVEEDEAVSESEASDDGLDEYDLKKKHAGREGQAEAIMQNAGKMSHPHRNVTLRQDFKITSKRAARVRRGRPTGRSPPLSKS